MPVNSNPSICKTSGCNLNSISFRDFCWNHTGDKVRFREELQERSELQPLMPGLNLAEADLNDIKLAGIITPNSNFSGCDLSNADLSGSNLTECKFIRCVINSLDISQSRLCRVEMTGSKGSRVEAVGADFTNAEAKNCYLPQINLSHAILNYSMWTSSQLSDSNLSHITAYNWVADMVDLSRSTCDNADCEMSVLSGAGLSHVVAFNCNFSRSNLIGVNAVGANFEGSQFFYARMASANLEHADLSGCDLNRTVFRSANMLHIRGANLVGSITDRAKLSCEWSGEVA